MYATLAIDVTPAGMVFATFTTTVTVFVPGVAPACFGTVRFVQLTLPPTTAPLSLADTNVVFAGIASLRL